MIQAHYTNIRRKISNLISSSRNEIQICVAWFTSQEILGKLIDKAEAGCDIKIILSDHKGNNILNFNELLNKGGAVRFLPSKTGKFLHDKFAIFDQKTVLLGSYNWTNSAEFYNHENIIISNDQTLLKQFSARFRFMEKIVSGHVISKIDSNDGIMEIDSKEDEFRVLENELSDELMESVNIAIKAGASISRTTILGLINRYGAIGTIKLLMKEGTERLQSGLLKLYEIKRLDLAFESIILKDKYRFIFDDETLKKAKEKLKKLESKI